jgi:hypothetical protein
MNPHTCELESIWIDWAKSVTVPLKERAYLCMPLRGVIFRYEPNKKTLVTVAELSCYHGSDTDVLNRRVFKEIGLEITRPSNVITDGEGFDRWMQKIESESETFMMDQGMQEAIQAMKDMFDRRN